MVPWLIGPGELWPNGFVGSAQVLAAPIQRLGNIRRSQIGRQWCGAVVPNAPNFFDGKERSRRPILLNPLGEVLSAASFVARSSQTTAPMACRSRFAGSPGFGRQCRGDSESESGTRPNRKAGLNVQYMLRLFVGYIQPR